MSSIRSNIQTGDIVEIIVSKTAHPTTDWLQIAQTGRARNKIRHWLKESQHDEFLERGRRTLMEHVRARFGSAVDEDEVMDILQSSLKHFSATDSEDLLVEIGCGTIKMGSVLSRLEQVIHPPGATPRPIPRSSGKRKSKDFVIVDGMTGAVTKMARCCAPLPGDPIIGYITQGRGISVHRADCRSLAHVRERANDYPNRMVNVVWGEASNSLRKVAVRLVCQDRKGLLSDITTMISQFNINIVGTHSSSNIRGNRAILKLVLLIEDSDQLNLILNRLETIPGVISLSRVVHDR
jgi:GTP pyrophosphokinase